VSLEDRIVQAGVPAADVGAFAASVRQGGSLVAVKAVMGVGLKATAIMNAHNPMKGAVERKDYYISTVDMGTPLSSVMGLPVLLRAGSCFVEGVESPYSLMAASKGVYGEAVGEWSPTDALGFSKIVALTGVFHRRAGENAVKGK
jgi:hypothetical protein